MRSHLGVLVPGQRQIKTSAKSSPEQYRKIGLAELWSDPLPKAALESQLLTRLIMHSAVLLFVVVMVTTSCSHAGTRETRSIMQSSEGLFGLGMLGVASSVFEGGARVTGDQTAKAAYLGLPLSFERNAGQSDPKVRFLSRSADATAFFALHEVVLVPGVPNRPAAASHGISAHSRQPILRLLFPGARPTSLVGTRRLPGTANYFIGNDRPRWKARVPTYTGVRYTNLWPGVDASFYGTQHHFDYDLQVKPYADPGKITLRFAGARRMAIDGHGDLVLTLGGNYRMREHAPATYQIANGRRRTVASRYLLRHGSVRLQLGNYNHRSALVIDPALTYSTYLGGTGFEFGYSITSDAAGNAYVTGRTSSADFPTSGGAFEPRKPSGQWTAFVAKLNAAGSALSYSTYLGGTGSSAGRGITVDSTGSAFVTGDTQAPDFPTTAGAFQTTQGGAFVSKLNADGSSLLYSTYLGTSAVGRAIAVDPTGTAYVTGYADDSSFPTTAGAFQTTRGGATSKAFVSKLNQTGSALSYSTFLGGSGKTDGQGIAVDCGGSAYVTGYTDDSDFPTTSGAPYTHNAGGHDAFAAKLASDGSALSYATYLGGSADDLGYGVALDPNGNAYVTGTSQSPDFPTTVGALQTSRGGFTNAFITKLSAAGSIAYSTYLGPPAGDTEGHAVAVDAAGSAYVTGMTRSQAFPTPADAPQRRPGGGADAFVAKLNAAGSALSFATYLGGTQADEGAGIAVDSVGNVYVTGDTNSSDFPTTKGAFQPTSRGHVFVAKLSTLATSDLGGGEAGGAFPGDPAPLSGGGASGGGDGVDRGAPALSGLVLSPSTFRAMTSGPSATAAKKIRKSGTVLTYSDSRAASTTFSILRARKGVRLGNRCLKAPKHRMSKREPRPCNRVALLGTFTHRDHTGRNRLRFTGRVRGRKLERGAYRLSAVARSSDGKASPAVTKRFRIKR
jgi:hypothetical protein